MSAFTADPFGIVATCPACGQKNRRPYLRLTSEATCGKCQTSLSFVNAPIEIPSLAAFDALRTAVTLPVLVDFWAEWCSPCKMLAPQLEKVAEQEAGTALIVKVDTEAVPSVAARYHIRSIPTLVILDNGNELARQSGTQPASAIRDFLHRRRQ